MFRIGFELTYLLFATAVGAVSVALLVPAAGASRSSAEVEPVLWVALGLFAGLFPLALAAASFLAYDRWEVPVLGGLAVAVPLLIDSEPHA